MREIARFFFPMDTEAFCGAVKAISRRHKGAGVHPIPGFGGIAVVVPEGDDGSGYTALLPCAAPPWIYEWVARGEVGLSSLSLAAWLAARIEPDYCPRDDDDMRRCLTMLLVYAPWQQRDAIREAVKELQEKHPDWAAWEFFGADGWVDPERVTARTGANLLIGMKAVRGKRPEADTTGGG